jgi:hypothetical protein
MRGMYGLMNMTDDDYTASVEARIAALHPSRLQSAPDQGTRDMGLYAIARLRSYRDRNGINLSLAQRQFLGLAEKHHGARITGATS